MSWLLSDENEDALLFTLAILALGLLALGLAS